MDNNTKQNKSNENEKEIEQIYEWIDSIPLSRVKKNIARDFCDGEVIKHHIPKIVEIHNYSSANSAPQKNYNWVTLNQKVLKKLGFQLTNNEIQDIINCKQGAIENLLKRVNKHIQKYMANDIGLSKNLNAEINLSGEDGEGNRNSRKGMKESFGEYDSYDRNKLLRAVKQKDAQIEELKNIVDNSSEIQIALEKRINQLKEILKGYGHI